MLCNRTVWLTFNESSGSNNAAAHEALEAAFEKASCAVHRRLCFPREEAPNKEALEAAGVEVLIVFTGDGTINSVVSGLTGWDGAVLVLPGGTMNLLSGRLHGDADAATIITKVAQGSARRVRLTTIRSEHGTGLTGMLAGPGTAWADVREAMRETDIVGVLKSAREAISGSADGPAVVCREPASGRADGYAAIMLTPREAGIELKGFYADSVSDYASHGLALLRRNFREGPHETLGTFPDLQLASKDNEPVGLLIDGEPATAAGSVERFTLAPGELDFLATTETDVD